MYAPWTDANLCFTKFFLLCSLSSLIIKDVSSASSLECEIRDSCTESRVCRYTNQMTVDPGSNITLNCSTINGGAAQSMTWEQVQQRVNSTADQLVLQQVNSSNACLCTRISFTRALQIVYVTSSPNDIYENEKRDLKCSFKGWPLPRVRWYKAEEYEGEYKEPIINGSGDFSFSEKVSEEKTQLTSILHLPPGREQHEGFYTCTAENSIPGWSSKESFTIWMIYQCPWPKNPTIQSSENPVKAFSNVTLKCSVDVDPENCPLMLRWYLNNNSEPLKSGEKYKIEERKTRSKCKKDFHLTIVNATENDEGTYGCRSLCVWGNVAATFELNITDQAAGNLEKMVMNNKLFIVYKSKNFVLVNKSLISLLEKHSISYSIHTGDFELGRPIVQNMTDSVSGSRHVLIVSSDNYLASNVCPEELHTAVQRRVYAGNSPLVVLLITKSKKKRLPCALRKKNLLNFEKHKKKEDWEEKLLYAVVEGKTA